MAATARMLSGPAGLAMALVALTFLLSSQRASGAEHLQNGGFEQGSAGWSAATGFSTTGCDARSGSRAGRLATNTDGSAFVQQAIDGSFASGAYTLRGYARLDDGSATLLVQLTWHSASGERLDQSPTTVTPGNGWSVFSLSSESTAGATQLRAFLTATSTTASAVICLDDLSLEGPALLTPSPTPTVTPTQTPSPTSTAVPIATPSPTRTATPTQTRTPAPDAPEVSSRLSNGGFEDGLDTWDSFGGDLDLVANPRLSGSAAAAFRSNTASTKWAYQVVRVEALQTYALQTQLLPDAGVAQAYLRISWYASPDGEGSALATDDSTSRLSGASTAFAPLTTGPRTAPAGARSARLRIMLAPVSAAPAVVYIDDVSFGPATAPVPPPPSAAVAADELVALTPGAASTATSAPTIAAPPAATPIAMRPLATPPTPPTATATLTAPARIDAAAPMLTPSPAPVAADEAALEDEGPTSLRNIAIAALVFAGVLSSAYLLARPRQL